MKKPMKGKNNQKNRGGRKPKSDSAVHRYGIKLTSEENDRFNLLSTESGMRQKAGFIKKAIFGGRVKVVKINKATMDYYIRLKKFFRQFASGTTTICFIQFKKGFIIITFFEFSVSLHCPLINIDPYEIS